MVCINGSCNQQTPSASALLKTTNKFQRLPIDIQEFIVPFLEVQDVRKMPFVDKLFGKNMNSNRVWIAVGKILGVPLEDKASAQKQLCSFYVQTNEILLERLPEALKRQILEKRISDPKALNEFIEKFLSEYSAEFDAKRSSEFFDNTFGMVTSNEMSYPILEAFHMLVRTGFTAKISESTDVIPRDTHFLIGLKVFSSKVNDIFHSLIQILPPAKNPHLVPYLTFCLQQCMEHENWQIADILLKAGVSINNDTLTQGVELFYLNVFNKDAAAAQMHVKKLKYLAPHCSIENSKAVLTRLQQYQVFPILISDALDFARNHQTKDVPKLFELYERLKEMDSFRKEIRSHNCLVEPDLNAPDIFHESPFRSLVNLAGGVFDSTGGSENLPAFKALAAKYLSISGKEFLQELMEKNASYIHVHPNKVEIQNILLEIGISPTVISLNHCIKWADFFTPTFNNPAWEKAFKAATAEVKKDLFLYYVYEQGQLLAAAERSWSLGNNELEALRGSYNRLMASFKSILPEAKGDAKNMIVDLERLRLLPTSVDKGFWLTRCFIESFIPPKLSEKVHPEILQEWVLQVSQVLISKGEIAASSNKLSEEISSRYLFNLVAFINSSERSIEGKRRIKCMLWAFNENQKTDAFNNLTAENKKVLAEYISELAITEPKYLKQQIEIAQKEGNTQRLEILKKKLEDLPKIFVSLTAFLSK